MADRLDQLKSIFKRTSPLGFDGEAGTVINNLMQGGNATSLIRTNGVAYDETPVGKEQKEKEKRQHENDFMSLQTVLREQARQLEELAERYEEMARWYREQAEKHQREANEALERMQEAQERKNEFEKILVDARRTGHIDRDRAREALEKANVATTGYESEEELREKLLKAERNAAEEESGQSKIHDQKQAQANADNDHEKEAEQHAKELLEETKKTRELEADSKHENVQLRAQKAEENKPLLKQTIKDLEDQELKMQAEQENRMDEKQASVVAQPSF